MDSNNVIWFSELGMNDVAKVGGKNASLGEMVQHLSQAGVRVPNGFGTTATAYRKFLQHNKIDKLITTELRDLDGKDLKKLERAGKKIRRAIIKGDFLADFVVAIREAFAELAAGKSISVAVRSSATAEDLPEASFAGQQDSYLNVRGIAQLLIAVKKVFASLYNDRAIAYRIHHGFAHEKVALSAGIQLMVRSDIGASGVIFTLDTESGFDRVVFINAAYGLGESVVQGIVDPDEYYVFKDSKQKLLRKKLGSKQIKIVYGKKHTKQVAVRKTEQNNFVLFPQEAEELAKYAIAIEQHYKIPMDIEWAKDGKTGELYIVQARPETVKSRAKNQVLTQYFLEEKSAVIVNGSSIGQGIGQGKARVLQSAAEITQLIPGEVLVTDMTDPDWEPIMKQAAAIVTNRGGRTCHAAIVARELGIPAIVGTQHATEVITNGDKITVSCAEGETGYVYKGLLKFNKKEIKVDKMPRIPVEIMLNVANPEQVFEFSFLPNGGVGLARLEFIISNYIGIHPNAALNFNKLSHGLQTKIKNKIVGYRDPVDFYVQRLQEGIATIAAAFYPKPVIVRTSDFKTNEYANLLGGKAYEPGEENPMLGFRGASRYVHPAFQAAFALECQALKAVREELGLTNVEVMIPFVRTVAEMKNVLLEMEKNGLKRGENGLKVIMMCEVPSNAILAEDFLELVDGYSIGSNDLTQLTLGLDRDSDIVANLFDERDKAVKFFLERAIVACNKRDKYIGICGQAPSDYPELANWLLKRGIGSISLNPDSVVKTWLYIAENS